MSNATQGRQNPNCYLLGVAAIAATPTSLPGDNSVREPPDPISNSEVKTFSADGSVGSPHVRVGHRQDFFVKGRT